MSLMPRAVKCDKVTQLQLQHREEILMYVAEWVYREPEYTKKWQVHIFRPGNTHKYSLVEEYNIDSHSKLQEPSMSMSMD